MSKKEIQVGKATVQKHGKSIFNDFDSVFNDFASPELKKTEFFQKHLEIKSPFPIRRMDRGNQRFYFVYNEHTNTTDNFMSVTSFVSRSLGKPVGLQNWELDLAKETGSTSTARLYSRWRAEFGTLFHILSSKAMKDGFFDFGPKGIILENTVLDYMAGVQDLPINKLKHHWVSRMIKAMGSFLQFVCDRKIKPVGIEFPILSARKPLAGHIDLICEMEWNGKMINAIIDYKTGDNFFDEHNYQLHVYKELWNEWFADTFPIDFVFNWKPNKWRTNKPTYTLKNQTKSGLDVGGRINTAMLEGWLEDKREVTRLEGKFIFGESKMEDIVKQTDFSTILENEVEKGDHEKT